MDPTEDRDVKPSESEGTGEGVPSAAGEDRAETPGETLPSGQGRPPREILPDRRLLGGLQGSLPAEGLISRGQTIAYHGEVAARQPKPSAQSRLFAEIASKPPGLRRRVVVEPKERLSTKLAWWLVYGALILVVALPLGLGRPLLWRVVQPSLAATDLFATIEALPGGSPVLIAFDYDPATSGEMDIVARALIRHLMDREARIIAVSLLPAGPATAQRVLDELAPKRPGYRDGYGRHYANLGFIPGQAAAVRLLGASTAAAVQRDFQGVPLSELEVMDGLYSLRSFDLVVDLAFAQDSLRWWIEQAATPLDIPLGAGVSASVAPLAQPYYEAEPGQLAGMVAGITDAIMYEARYRGEKWVGGYNAARLSAQFWGHMLLITVIVLGNMVFLVRRRRRGRG
jgi:hypothetical protein